MSAAGRHVTTEPVEELEKALMVAIEEDAELFDIAFRGSKHQVAICWLHHIPHSEDRSTQERLLDVALLPK